MCSLATIVMTSDEQTEVVLAMLAARAKARGYADFFGWATDRDLEEINVVEMLFASMQADGALEMSGLRSRGRGNDPPDCEAIDLAGRRVAIEVTELVDGKVIQAFKSGATDAVAQWDRNRFFETLLSLLVQKDSRFFKLKGAPYEGGYVVVIFTDEPMLPADRVASWLVGHAFSGLGQVTRAFLLLSYDPGLGRCPYFRLAIDGDCR